MYKEKHYGIFTAISALVVIVLFIISSKIKDGTTEARICVLFILLFIIIGIVFGIKWWNNTPTIDVSAYKSNSYINAECPYCHSKNTKKISGVSKAGSVAMWGIFAMGKVSKQWHCNNCKSDF